MNRNGNNNGTALTTPHVRYAVYTRKSTEERLDHAFNSLDAQRESAEAFIASQKAEGWVCLPDRFDDGGHTGANTERPALKRLLADIEAGKIDGVVVYKVDRLSRSLLDFAKLMGAFDKYGVSFVSVTQAFNTTHSMGRLTLNILLSFAQFEREIISERTRDKIAAMRRRGKWSGGHPPLGYDVLSSLGGSNLMVNTQESERVRAIFVLYIEMQSLIQTAKELNRRGWTTKRWITSKGTEAGGLPFDKSSVSRLLGNVVYLGMVRYKDEVHPGEHEAIIDEATFQRVTVMLRSNGRAGGTHIRNKSGALLKGLLRCKPCNKSMMYSFTTKGNRRYRYYTCITAQKQGWDACSSKSVPAEQIERFVIEQIRAIGKDPAVKSMVLEHARTEALDEMASSSTGEAITRNGLITKADVDSALATFTPLWDSLNPREQARVVQLLIQRVDYDGAKGKVSVTFHANGIRTLGQNGLSTSMEAHECRMV